MALGAVRKLDAQAWLLEACAGEHALQGIIARRLTQSLRGGGGGRGRVSVLEEGVLDYILDCLLDCCDGTTSTSTREVQLRRWRGENRGRAAAEGCEEEEAGRDGAHHGGQLCQKLSEGGCFRADCRRLSSATCVALIEARPSIFLLDGCMSC